MPSSLKIKKQTQGSQRTCPRPYSWQWAEQKGERSLGHSKALGVSAASPLKDFRAETKEWLYWAPYALSSILEKLPTSP